MISQAATVFIASLAFFILMSLVVKMERRRGRRFFANKFRSWLDVKFDSIGSSIINSWEHFIKYILQLHWYYSIHSVLRGCLKFFAAFYAYFEHLFEHNRHRTKQLRAEKKQRSETNHLHQMAEHKEDTALTPAQQRKLKNRQLEGKH